MSEQTLQEVANDNSRENISDDGQTHHISLGSNNDESIVSDSANTSLTSIDVNVTVEENVENISEESGRMMRTRTNDDDTVVVAERTETVQSVSDGLTAPPPDYEEYMLTEYYISHGLESRGSQTATTACLCSCHNEMRRRNSLQNGQALVSTYLQAPNGQSSSQNVQRSFNNDPEHIFTLQQGLGNYGIIQTTHNASVQSTNNTDSANTDIQRNGKDKTMKTCFVSFIVLLIVAGIVYGFITGVTY